MSCPLEEQIQRDLVSAMKNHDERRLSTLRMLKASIQLASSEKGRSGDLEDEDIHALIRRGIKQREEAAEMYKKGGAPERARNELTEAALLMEYLPAQMDDEELEEVIRGIISSTEASGPKDMGRVMSAVMKEISGRADGKRVKDAVQKILV
ncbi:MAG: GatB/YqeY domain-containing protein [Synergistaceae bacterium]|nr:GatB/YqeY domain-containing protein [Synergistaceae bacterium]